MSRSEAFKRDQRPSSADVCAYVYITLLAGPHAEWNRKKRDPKFWFYRWSPEAKVGCRAPPLLYTWAAWLLGASALVADGPGLACRTPGAALSGGWRADGLLTGC